MNKTLIGLLAAAEIGCGAYGTHSNDAAIAAADARVAEANQRVLESSKRAQQSSDAATTDVKAQFGEQAYCEMIYADCGMTTPKFPGATDCNSMRADCYLAVKNALRENCVK